MRPFECFINFYFFGVVEKAKLHSFTQQYRKNIPSTTGSSQKWNLSTSPAPPALAQSCVGFGRRTNQSVPVRITIILTSPSWVVSQCVLPGKDWKIGWSKIPNGGDLTPLHCSYQMRYTFSIPFRWRLLIFNLTNPTHKKY